MKRLITVAIVMAVVLVGAPWVIGNVAEDRMNRGLDALVESAPYLGIVERKYSQGWFRAEQEVTFELVGPFVQPGLAIAGMPSARFTVRNEILHGPILGLSGVGLARVNSRVLLDEKTRQELLEVFGTDEPISVSTRVGFFGGSTTTFSSEARTHHPDKGKEVSWDDLDIDVSYSHDLDSIEVVGDWPRFEIKDEQRKGHMLIKGLALDAEAKRVKGQLYETDVEFRVAEVSFGEAGNPESVTKDLHYIIDSKDDGDFMSMAARIGTGRLTEGFLASKGLELTATHYDFTLRRLHTETLASLTNALHDSYRNPAAATMLDEHVLALLAREPELVLDRVSFETSEGAANLRGMIRLKGVTPKDLRMGTLSLIARLDVDLQFEAAQKLIEKVDGGHDALLGAVEGGYVELQGDKAVSHLEFHAGELVVNGKVQGIPGLGPKPVDPGADPGAGPE